MKTTVFRTSGGIRIRSEQTDLSADSALDSVYESIDRNKGAIFSSGFDYPGRHSRWDIGFINPAIEITSSNRNLTISALNEQGLILLPMFSRIIAEHEHIEDLRERHSFIEATVCKNQGYFIEEERTKQASIFSILRCISHAFSSKEPEASNLGLYGAFGYDLVFQFEQIKLRHKRNKNHIDCHLFLPLELFIVDRKTETGIRQHYVIETEKGWSDSVSGGGKEFSQPHVTGSSKIQCDHKEGEFAKKVQEVIEGTKRGDYFEVVLSQSFRTVFSDRPTSLFQRLALINPSPYLFLLNFGEDQLVGSSPEIYVRVTNRRYETCPIAGTVPRGESPLEDADRVRQLIVSKKDESELTMCTDVDRNDMARVCKPGSVKVLGRRQLEFYSHLIHTVDHVEGILEDKFDALDAFQTHMWACTVTGAPKPAALQTIEDLEKSPRGWYSGAVGFLSFSGNLNTGITLRTAHLKNGCAEIRTGATLLFGSDPATEEKETRTKAAAFLAAVADSKKLKEKISEETTKSNIPHISGKKRRVLLVDCRDSFVHNLAAYLRILGAEVITLRVGFPEELLNKYSPDLVFLSPGPGTPKEFGIPTLVGKLIEQNFPIFGVCLGHQGIGEHFGAKLSVLPVPEHGKASLIHHNGSALFTNVDRVFEAGRYHSLYLQANSLPECLELAAYTLHKPSELEEEIIPMAICHRTLPIASVQFHPESLMTLKKMIGHQILKNAIEILSK